MLKIMQFSTKLRLVFTSIAASLVLLLVSVILLVQESTSHTRALAELRLPNARSIAVLRVQVGSIARDLYGAALSQLAAAASGIINLGGRVAPVMDLRARLDLPLISR